MRFFVTLLCALFVTSAQAQLPPLQGGPWTSGHAPMYGNSGGSQAVVQDSGPASGGIPGVGLSELGLTMRGAGTGPFGSPFCEYDAAVSTGSYHFLCLTPSRTGNGGMLSYGAAGSATVYPFYFNINGTEYQFPFSVGGIVGPGTTVVGHCATWANTVGTLLADTNCALRQRLTGPLDLYQNFSTGVDTAGCGLVIGNPCKTRTYIYNNILLPNYDLNCQTVTVHMAGVTNTDSFQVYGPKLFGQCFSNSLVFDGAGASTLIQPANGTGYAYGLAFGAAIKIQNQKMDMSSNKANLALGADTVSVGQGSQIIFGAGVTYGCNFANFNSNTIGPGAGTYVQWDADFTIDVTACQASANAAYTSGTNTMTLDSTSGIVATMHAVATSGGSGLPLDAYIGSLVGNTATIACIKTTPCQFTATQAAQGMIFTGGGQAFMNPSSGSQVVVNTNGQPDASVIVTLAGFPFYINGFAFFNTLAGGNIQAMTFANAAQAHGDCFTSRLNSVIDSGLQGVPYMPCLGGIGGGLSPIQTATITNGSRTFTVPSATGIRIGQAVNGFTATLGTWTAGDPSITVSSGAGLCAGSGATLIGEGILNHAYVASVVGTTVSVNPCGVSGPKCVAGYPTYLSQTNATVAVTGCGVPNGAVVTDVVGTTITIDRPAIATGSQQVIFQGTTSNYSTYQ